ncbi:MAG TPA: PDR/VanB family oxidoreductase [Trebonia sp.]|jgi:ferredoxin-NADP reductase
MDTDPVTTEESVFGLRTLVVRQVRLEATSVVSLQLVDPDGGALPRWQPGAHLDLMLPSGLIRQYSLCGDPEDTHSYTVAVLREARGRGGSAEIHDTALVGRGLEIRGPRNHFALTRAEGYVFLAGGIGITPILAMIRTAAVRGLPWQLYYGGRDLAHMAFRQELLALGADRVHLLPQDTHGLPDFTAILNGQPADCLVYACGPEGMLRAAEEACSRAAQRRDFRAERFAVATKAAPEPTDRGTFTVVLKRSGIQLTVPPDRSLLEVVREALPDTPYSCEEGYCGTCETRVIDGVPEHNDQILSPEERARNRTMMICVGRSRTPELTLDL